MFSSFLLASKPFETIFLIGLYWKFRTKHLLFLLLSLSFHFRLIEKLLQIINLWSYAIFRLLYWDICCGIEYVCWDQSHILEAYTLRTAFEGNDLADVISVPDQADYALVLFWFMKFFTLVGLLACYDNKIKLFQSNSNSYV